jgi:hypothetical protein
MSREHAHVEGEDFYWEGTAMVFTARYHLARGYCCDSGCRHCPYREKVAAIERDKDIVDERREAAS